MWEGGYGRSCRVAAVAGEEEPLDRPVLVQLPSFTLLPPSTSTARLSSCLPALPWWNTRAFPEALPGCKHTLKSTAHETNRNEGRGQGGGSDVLWLSPAFLACPSEDRCKTFIHPHTHALTHVRGAGDLSDIYARCYFTKRFRTSASCRFTKSASVGSGGVRRRFVGCTVSLARSPPFGSAASLLFRLPGSR